MPKAQYINPGCLPKPPGNFSWLVQSDNVIWLAGMVGIDKNGEVVGKGDSEKQTMQIYENIEAALQERGASLANLVKTVTYIAGREHMAGSMKVRPLLRQQGRLPNLPASTLLLVAGLQSPDYLVEMDAVAVLG